VKQEYKVGEECWIFAGGRDETGKTTTSKGKVIHAFMCSWRALPQYVILLDDPDFLSMEIRDVHLMSPTADEWPSYVSIKEPATVTRRIDHTTPN